MRRQYLGFRELRPHWVGRRIADVAQSTGMPVHRLGGDGWRGSLDRALFKEFGWVPDLEKLQALSPQVVHAQFGRGGAFALPIARALGIPLAVTFHGGDAHKDKHYRGSFPPGLFARRLPALMAEAKLFICVSESVRRKLIARGFPLAKLTVLPIGTDIPGEIVPPRAEGPLLFVGRFVPKKGLPTLIAALQRLRAEGREPEALIVGDGPMAEALRQQAAGLLRLRFLGWQSPEAVSALMQTASVLVVPSIRAAGGDAEGLPSVAVEAMALGIPVLGSDQAGLDGVAIPGETGEIVPAGDAEALAAAITRLMTNPDERSRLGEAARHLAERDFNASIQSRRLEERLLSLLS